MMRHSYGDAPSARAAKRYREEQVSGLGQKELILMLYDGAIKCVSEAEEAIGRKDFVKSHTSIVKARDIVTELLCILNMERGGEVARNLHRLYVYVIGRLTEANFTKNTLLLDNVLTILGNLRSAWAGIDFDKALASLDSGNGDGNGTARQPKPNASRPASDGARILSVTV